ncbi:Gfo/Idh/MocA family protein [Enterovirga aerilata]|uniref:Gfo/Idh/MocA family oxidoreductase n=1 Tax=Enterovirga aerilata TaxID=2730920 RepID=A0A849I0V2_9HYPH|nr:Gfo/Idh/MocA family oxidoreductase [Enterovirga sp. DB1703]NNM70958.1 Gfo/Idh/MocA family oxidoreductase [Enterovirga sp. DB1703]
MIRAAVAGLGWWGQHIVRRMADSDAMRIVSAVETNPERAAFAAEHGIRFAASLPEVLADPAIDAVILATPHALHAEQVLAAAAAGKHVFCEKPLALTRTDAERSVAACRRAGVMLGIGHERRYEAAVGELRRLVRAGALGTIMHAEANFSHNKLAQVPETDWRASPADAPAAGMTAMGVHLTDLYLDLFGPIREVFAATASRVAFSRTGDVVSVLMRFESGATGYLNAILVTPLYIGLTVFGSEGWAEIRNHTHPDTPGPATFTVHYRDGRRETRDYEWLDSVRTGLETFARAIAAGAPYPFTDAQKIGNVAVLEAICRSAAENAPVPVAAVSA